MIYFIGILDGAGDAWGVRIPDCSGAFGAGSTPEAADQNAISGLAAWAEATLKDGDALPASRSFAAIKADAEDGPGIENGGVAVMIPRLLDAGRTVRANLTMDAGLLAMIDREAASRPDTISLPRQRRPRENRDDLRRYVGRGRERSRIRVKDRGSTLPERPESANTAIALISRNFWRFRLSSETNRSKSG